MKACRGPVLICVLVGFHAAVASGSQTVTFPVWASAPLARGNAESSDSLVQPAQSTPFTGVHPRYNGFSLGVIEAYCRARNIGRLGRERVRVFYQPWGTVSGAIEVDLRQHTVRVWPDWWDGKTPMTTRGLSPKDARDVRALVTSAAFRKIPAENEAFGADGCAYLVESTVGGSYTWKLHWQPDDPTFLGVVGRLGTLDRQR